MKEVLIVILRLMLGMVFLYLCWSVAKMMHKLDDDNEDIIDYDEEE